MAHIASLQAEITNFCKDYSLNPSSLESKGIGKYDSLVLMHGCNCFNTMGSGVAKSIAEAFPKASEQDSYTEKGNTYKLGEYSEAVYQPFNKLESFTILNLYTQYGYGKYHRYFDYSILKSCLKEVSRNYRSKNFLHVLPAIGTGTGRAKWSEVKQSLDTYLKVDFVIVDIVDYTNESP